MICGVCGENVAEGSKYCQRCGSAVGQDVEGFVMSTTPTVAGFRIRRVIGVVSGITPRTRGIFGKFIAGIESMLGGEVSAFTSEIEKARMEALDRAREKAKALGANGLIGIDIETSDLGFNMGILVFSATGTAVVLEPEGQVPASSGGS